MPSLTQLLTDHETVLVLDAATAVVQVGLLRANQTDCWRQTGTEAGTGIFVSAESLLHEAGLSLSDCGAWIYCEGPGSMLGIRTVAMALRTCQVIHPRPVYAYQSLAVAGAFAWKQNPGRNFTVIADARRETWHCQPVDADGHLPALRRETASGLPPGELVMPEHFRSWSPPPRATGVCSYDLARIFPALSGGEYFHPVTAPDGFQYEPNQYRKWSAQIHQVVTVDHP